MKRFISLALAILVLATAVLCASCGEKKNENNNDNEGKKEVAVLKVGMECNYAPYNWTQPDDSNGAVKIANAEGYANGYDVQIAKKLAEAVGKTLEVYAYKWEGLVPAVETGVLDCIIAGMSPTAERKEQIDFTSNYWTSNLVIITNKDNELANATTLADFAGKKIAAQDGTFHIEAVDQINDVQKSVYDDFATLYIAVTTKTIDGYVAEEATAWSICAINDDLTYVPLKNNDTGFTASDDDVAVAVGVKKGSELTAKLNAVIDGMSQDEKDKLMQDMVKLAPAD